MEGNKITPALDWVMKYEKGIFNLRDIIKEAQKQAEIVGFNKGLELAAEKATVSKSYNSLARVDRQSILNLKHSEELKV